MTRTIAWLHEATWAPERTNVSHARRFACDVLAWHGRDGLVDAVRLVVSELTTNAVLHAQTPFTVTLTSDGGAVVVRVRDGSDVPAAALQDVGTDPGADEDRGPVVARGRGLYMVDAYSDAWGSVMEPDGGKTVWAVFEPAREEPAPGRPDGQGFGSRPTARRASKFAAAHSVRARVPLVE